MAIRRQGNVSQKHPSLPEQCKHKTNINQSRKPCLRITAVSRSGFILTIIINFFKLHFMIFKKNYFSLSISIIAMVYNAIQFVFYPELTPIWFIRVIGGSFIFYAIGYALDIHKIYLNRKIQKLNKQISEHEIYMKSILKQ